MIKRLYKKALKYIITMISAVFTILLHHQPGSDKELIITAFHNPEHPCEEPIYNDYSGMIKYQGTSAASGISTSFNFQRTIFNHESC